MNLVGYLVRRLKKKDYRSYIHADLIFLCAMWHSCFVVDSFGSPVF